MILVVQQFFQANDKENKGSKLLDVCEGNPVVTSEYCSQRTSNSKHHSTAQHHHLFTVIQQHTQVHHVNITIIPRGPQLQAQ